MERELSDNSFQFRDQSIDVAKAIGILLIIWGHCGGWGILGSDVYC